MKKTMVLLALCASGCGLRYHTAMYGGGRAAADERWDDALTRYDKARHARPASERAEERYVTVRERAVAQGLSDARSALEARDYERVVERLAYVEKLDPDVADVLVLAREAESFLVAEVSTAWNVGATDEAYRQAVRLRELFPMSDASGGFIADLRSHYAASAHEALRARRFEEALAAIATIGAYEPDQRVPLVEPVERAIRVAWADDLARIARTDDRAGRDGSAFLHYARAYEVAGRDTDRVAARALADQLRDRGRLTVSVQITGSRSRAAALRKHISEAIAGIPDATLTSGRADLPIYLSAPTARCSERVATSRKERPYVSGQRDVPNPEHARLAEALARVDADRDEADGHATSLWSKVEALEARAAALDTELQQLRLTATSARERQAEAQKHIDAALRLRDERSAELDALVGSVHAERRARVEEQLVQLAQNVTAWQESYMKVDREAIEAEKRVRPLEMQRKSVGIELEGVRLTYTAALALREEHQAKRNELSRALLLTPRTVPEDVHAVFAYDEKQWTRRCVAATWVAMRPRWDSALGGEERYVPVGETVDVAHVGHAPSKLSPDPKGYVDPDAALIASADGETGRALAEWIGALAVDHYAVAVDDALVALAEDPRDATTSLLALYLGSPSRLDDHQRETVRLHVASYGVQDLDAVLTGGTIASR